MRGYSGIERAGSTYVRFVRNDEVDGSEREIFDAAKRDGVLCVYVSGRPCVESVLDLANCVGRALELDNAPYEERRWVRLLDDLASLAHRQKGLIIVVGHAGSILAQRQNDFFDLIEAFLTQVHHWSDQNKPCCLCFQMDDNPSIEQLFDA